MPVAPAGIPHSSNVVTGTRVKFWKSPQWTLGTAAFELASPLLILWAAKTVIFGDREFGDYALGAILLVAGVIGLTMLRGEFRKVVLDSPCPVCGAQARRSFPEASKQKLYPTPCGSCVAYLRASGVEVREERLEADGSFYIVPAARYVSSVARDGDGKFQFAMPAMCGRCGSGNAHELRDIIEVGEHIGGGGSGALGKVMAGAAREAVNTGAPTRYSDGLHHATSGAPTADAADAALKGIKVPVCPKHTLAASRTGDPVAYTHGDLWFQWYGFYRAFLALNKLDGGADKLESPRP